jgi:hypothetical protein
VSFVKEISITLYKGTKKAFYLFNDGRKDNDNMFDFNSHYNNKKFNVRIYKTEKLENFITSTLSITLSKM